jgi:hypothetical protein
MSAEWFYQNYDLDIVVIIRHPAAFIASLKVKDWQYDFNNFQNQPVLMNAYLKEYEALISDFSKNKKDIIDQGILLWNIFHEIIIRYQIKYGHSWYFVKHEDLSSNPNAEFGKLFSKINLAVNLDIEYYITETTSGIEHSKLKRNSIENIASWKKRLSEKEILRIKIGTEKKWRKFYTERDW